MRTRKPTEERRREITDAAIEIIAKRGLREFTAANLAREVGIKDGTIFRHFKDMNEISASVLHRLQEMLGAVPEPTGGPLERLEVFVLSRLRSVAVQPGIQSLVFSDQLSQILGAEGPRQVAALRNRGRDYIRSCLREASEQGLVREGLDIESAVVLVTGLVMGFLFAVKDGAIEGSIERAGQRAWRTFARFLGR
jgi:AcrR family transcriptional regulator